MVLLKSVQADSETLNNLSKKLHTKDQSTSLQEPVLSMLALAYHIIKQLIHLYGTQHDDNFEWQLLQKGCIF